MSFWSLLTTSWARSQRYTRLTSQRRRRNRSWRKFSTCRRQIPLSLEGLEDRTLLAGMVGMGDLPGDDINSAALAISEDGSVVVGYGKSEDGNEAFRWTEETGMVGLGDLPFGDFSSAATAVSADGSVVVGFGESILGPEAYRWTAETGMVGLGDFPGGDFESQAWGVSADGSVVVGYSRTNLGFEAFRWTADTGMERLGDLPGGAFISRATGVSADGSVVVGYGTTSAGSEAFIWTAETGMVGIGELPGGGTYSQASAVSGDGSIVVGYSSSTNGSEAFRWTAETGMVGLGGLPGGGTGSFADGISTDGNVIVGRSPSTDSITEAFMWTAESGMVGLGDLPGGQFRSGARGISGDGTLISGYGWTENDQEAFLWSAADDGAPLPDLRPAVIDGVWDSPIVVSTVTGTNTDASVFNATDNLYIDLGVANFGDADAGPFSVTLRIDGSTITTLTRSTSLGVGAFASDFQDVAIGTLSEGSHTFELVIDSENSVYEALSGGEANNVYQRIITIGSSGNADLGPARAVGWESALVISTETGTNTSASTFFTSDSLYVDLGMANFGSATAAPFTVTLILDGNTIAILDQTTPLNVGEFAGFEDIALGTLSAGPHTLEMIIDSGDDVDEGASGGEDDNVFTRTIAVFDPATLKGVKWDDTDGNGMQDSGEDPLEGFVVYLDLNGNGMRDVSDEPFATTNALGEYEFTNLAPGTYTVAVEYPDGTDREQTFPGSQAETQAGFDIDFRFLSATLTPQQEQLFLDAAAIWESIIVGDLSDMVSPDGFFVDDFLMDVYTVDIDGVGNTLGQASPYFGSPPWYHEGTLLPLRGYVELDVNDIDHPELFGTILHEIGHALGLGVLWDANGLRVNVGTPDPRYIGAEAVQQYADIFNISASSIPLENVGGPGSVGSHWRETVFDNELMTSISDPNAMISLVTVGALADLGYEVDYNQAQSYRPPGTNLPFVTVDTVITTIDEEGTTAGAFTFTRTDTTSGALEVHYSIGGTATAGSDFVALSGIATILDGDSSVTVDLTPLTDGDAEGLETIVITVESGSGYTVGAPRYATVTIEDDELVEPVIPLSYTVTVHPGETIGNLDFGSRIPTSVPPFIEAQIDDVTVAEDAASTIVDLFAAFGDTEDLDTELSFRVSDNTNPALFASLNIAAGMLTLDYAANANGTATLTIEAMDTTGQTVTQSFDVTITAVNDAPVIVSTSVDAVEDTILDVDLRTLVDDVETADDDLTFTVSGAVNGTVELLADGYTARFTPAADYFGAAAFDFGVTDTGEGADSAITLGPITVNVDITSVNDSPSFTLEGDQVVDEDSGGLTNYAFATNIAAGPTDESGQSLSFLLSTDNDALFTDGPTIDASGVLSFGLADDAAGTAVVTVRLMDNGGTANGGVNISEAQTFSIIVNNINDAPVLTVPGPMLVDEDTQLDISGVSVVDVDSATVEVELEAIFGNLTLGNTSGLTVSGNGTDNVIVEGSVADINAALATLSYRSYPGSSGEEAIQFTATDPEAASDFKLIIVNVIPAAFVPEVTLDASSNIIEEAGGTVTITATLSGVSTEDVTVFLGFGGTADDFIEGGSLLVANGATNSILRYDGTTGAFIDEYFTGAAGDMIIGPDGDFYVANVATNSILRYDGATGAPLGTFASGGGLSGPGGLVFGPDGNLYVTSSQTDSVLRYNGTTGAFIDQFVLPNTEDLGNPVGLAFGPDGNLYVSNHGRGGSRGPYNVLVFNGTTGAYVKEFFEDGAGNLDEPTGLTFGPDGNLYVIDEPDDEIVRYNGTTGAFLGNFASGGGLDTPTDFTFGPDGNLYVSSANGEILKYDGSTGAFLGSMVSGGGLTNPLGLLFVASAGDFIPSGRSIVIEAGSLSGSITITGVADELDEGSETVIVEITDVTGGVELGQQQVTTTIVEEIGSNQPPTTTGIADVTVDEDAAATQIDLFAAFDDAEDADQQLTYEVVDNSNAALFTAVSINPATGILTLDYAPNLHGVADITIRATDLDGEFVETTFAVTVNAVNDTPSVNPTTLNMLEDTGVEIDLRTLTNDLETPVDQLVFRVLNGVNGDVELLADGHTARFTPVADFNGVASFDFDVTDTGDGSTQPITTQAVTIDVTVDAVNDAPIFNPILDQVVDEDSGQHDIAITNIDPMDEAWPFVSIVDNASDSEFNGGWFSQGELNNNGIVAVQYRNGSDTAIIISDGQTTTTVFDESDGGFTDLSEPSINDFGTLVFLGTGEASGVYTKDTDGLTTILEIPNNIYNSYGRSGINNNGSVVFYAKRKDGDVTIVLGDGDSLTTVFSTADDTYSQFSPARPGINDDGTIAVHAHRSNREEVILTGDGTTSTIIADTADGVFTEFGGEPAINASGMVAFVDIFNGEFAVYRGNGGEPTLIATTVGTELGSLGHPSINASGMVAFHDLLDGGGSAIFTGDGGELREIIRTGDRLFGSTVSSVRMSSKSLNDDGEIVFKYELQNGVSGIAVWSDSGAHSLQTVTLTAVSSDESIVSDISIVGSGPTRTLTYNTNPNASGTVTITVTAQDDGGTENGGVDLFTRTFTITVNPVNDAPVAETTTLNTPEGTEVSIDLRSLADDVETSDNDLAFSVSNAVNGTVELLANGYTAVFTPADGYDGPAAFDYEVTDTGDNGDAPISSGPVTIDINVFAGNQMPVAVGTTLNTNEETAVEIDLRTLVDDDETADNDLMFSVTDAVNGTVELLADGYTARFTPGTDYFGPAAFSYYVTDTGYFDDPPITVGPVVIDVAVAAENDTPVIELVLSNFDVYEDAPPTVLDLFTYFSDIEDPDEDLVFEVTGNTDAALFENVSINDVTGELTLEYAANAAGLTLITVRATDTGGLFVEQTFRIIVEDVNDPPVASTTTLNTTEDTAVEIDLRTLVEDVETDDDDFTFTVSNPVNGTVELLSDGYTARFTPGEDFSGVATFDYHVTDDGIRGDDPFVTVGPVTITVNVGEGNDQPFVESPIGNVAVIEDAASNVIDLFAAFEDLEDADSELDFEITANSNASLFASVMIDPTTGQLTLDYAPNANGSSTITVQATDTGGLSVSQTFIVDVAAVNDNPVAVGTTLATDEDTPVEIDLRTLVGDVETSDDDLIFNVSGAVNGTVELLADGHTARFTLGANYNGAASFEYDVTDTGDGSAAAITSAPQAIDVNVAAVNDDPVATGTTLNTDEDTPVEIDLRTLVDDLETVDDDLVFNVSGAVNGSVELLADGHTARFTPGANYNGPASFVYDVTDTGDGADPAIVVGPLAIDINVAAVNDDPVATGTTLNTDEDTTVEIDLRTLVDDVETADDDLVFSVSGAVNGSVELLADGYTARFTPGANYNGAASFVYDVTDTGDGSAAAITSAPQTIDVNVAAVNDAPVAGTTTLNTNEDTAVNIDLRTLVEDVETADDDLEFFEFNPINGTVERLPDGFTVRFTPTANYHGPASFDYQVTDRGDGGDEFITVGPLTIEINIAAVNDDPVATGTTLNTDEDTPVEIDLRTLVDDVETADDDLVFNVSGAVNGSVELLVDGYTARFTPGTNYHGPASFVYDVTDTGDGGAAAITSGPLTIDVNVAAVNDDPVANSTTLATDEDTPVEIDLRTLVEDVETADDDLVFSVSGAVNGTVELLADGYTARFTPGADYNGAASFDYDVTDTGDGGDAPITVSPVTIDVTVAAVNDDPIAVGTTLATVEDTPVEIDLRTLVDDLETVDDDLVFNVSGGVNGSVELLADGYTARFTPGADYNGAASFVYDVTDTGDGDDPAIIVGPLTIDINVAAVNDEPIATATTLATDEDTPVEIDLRTLVDDVETADDDLLFSVSGAVNGTVELLADGYTARFTPGADYNGAASFDYDVTDTGDGSAAAILVGPITIDVTVGGDNDRPFVETPIDDIAVLEDAPSSLIDLFAAFEDLEDADSDLDFEITANSNASLFASAMINPTTGQLTLDYAPDANGTSTITVQATDTGGLSISQTFVVDVAAVNDIPQGDVTTFNILEDTPLEIDLRTFVSDVETAAEDFIFNVSGAVNGTVELLADGHTARFTPTANYNGPAAFNYDVTDTGDGSAAAITTGPLTMTINVAAVNDDPVATGTTLATDEDTPVEIDLRTLVDDVETADDDLVFSVSGAVNGVVELLADGYTARFTPGADYNGAASFVYDVTDTGDGVEPAIVVGPLAIDITVTAMNDDPVAVGTTLNTDEDTPVEIDLRTLVGDVETSDDDLIFNVSGAVNGTVELLADGHTARFTPGANYNGAASFEYEVTDTGDGSAAAVTSAPQTIDVNVIAVNDDPVATGTTLVTDEDTPVEIDLRTLVDDIETVDDDLVFSVSGAENGTVELLADGFTARFTPGANYNGLASFVYDVTDTGDNGASAITSVPQTVDVNVAAVNDDPTAGTTTLNTDEDTPVEIDLRTLVDDVETADDDLVFNVSGAVNGSVELLADGYTARFTPDANYNGPASFVYDVMDTGDGTSPGILVGPIAIDINVAAVNDDPTATGTTLATDEDTPVEIDLRTLVDDVETADDDLVFSVSGAVNGTVELLANGYTARFTPGANFNGAASFVYDVTDTGDGSAVAITSAPQTVGVNVAAVNDDPVANSTTLATDEDTPVEIDLRTLVDDAETVDDDLVFNVSGAVNGIVELLADGYTARFTPGVNYNGAASFVYDVTDSGDGDDPEIIVGPIAIDINVAAVNDDPVADSTTLTTGEDTPVEIDLRTLVADVETSDDDLIFNVSGAVNGSVELLADGYTARFTPGADYNGPASFAYSVTDTGDGGDDPITVGPVTIEVTVGGDNDRPFVETPIGDVAVIEDAASSVIDLFAAFEDLEDADSELDFEITANSNASLFASATINPTTGQLTLDYAPNANGSSTITVQATDTGGLSVSQTFIVDVAAVNDDPVAVGTTLATDEDTPVEIDLRTLVNDIETADDDLVFSVSGAVNGTVELLADGHTARFTPGANYNGAASFEYDVTDTGDGSSLAITSAPQTIDVNVAAVNDDPVAVGTTLNTDEDTPVEIDLRTLVEDVETVDDDLVFNVSGAVNGSVELLADGYTARFTPGANYNGPASFVYDVTDTGDGDDPSIIVGPLAIDINVAAVNDDPVATGTTLNTDEDTAVEIDLRTLVDDVETVDDDLVFNVSGAVNGTVELLADGYTARFTPGANYNGPASFVYDVTDTGDGGAAAITSAPQTIDVNVAAVNDAPIAGTTTLNTDEDTAVEIDLRTLVDDVESADDDLLFSVSGAVNGTVELLADGYTARFTPGADYNGPASFEYDVTDTGDGSDAAITSGPVTIDVNVAAVNEFTIIDVSVNDGEENRSNVRHITVTFSDDTNIGELIASGQIVDIIQIYGLTNSPSTEVILSPDRFEWDDSTNSVTIDLTVDGFGGSGQTLLSNDNYALRIQTGEILNPQLVDAVLQDTDGVDDGIYDYRFHRLEGDIDGDRSVGFSDVMKLTSNFGQFNTDADTTGDGLVNILDFWSVYGNVGSSLPDDIFLEWEQI